MPELQILFYKKQAVKPIRNVSILLASLCAVALSFKGLREPDLWWQIKTGEWILENGKVPVTDVFSFTQKGQTWINIKWGFEVVAASISNIFGVESVFILQAVMLLLLLFCLYQLSKEISKSFGQMQFNLIAFLLLLPIFFVSVDYRINGRPEMSSHLLSIVFLWLNLRYRNGLKQSIWWLIPLQCLWANVHEAFAIGVVINATFLAAAFVETKIFAFRKFEPKALITHVFAFVASIAVIFINPYGAKMLLQPFDIFNQVFQNKYTTELLSIATHQFWKKEAYLALVWLALFAALLIAFFIKNKQKIKQATAKISLAYLLLIGAFVYLAASAFRNVIFLDLILFPVVSSGLSFVLFKYEKLKHSLLLVSALSLLVFYVLIITNAYYESVESRDRFGLQVMPDFNPLGAARFIEQENLQGKCFSDYLTSSYLLWKVKGFETFIDLRDLDVFSASFFNEYTEASVFPEKFEALHEKYHFDYVVLYRPQFQNLHRWLAKGNGFKPAYADAIAAVYVPSKTQEEVKDVFHSLAFVPNGKTADALNKFLNPFYKQYADFENYNASAAANYYLSIGEIRLAEQYAKTLAYSSESWKGYTTLGEIAYQRSFAVSKDSADIFMKAAQQNFSQALQIKDDYVPALMGMGTMLFNQGFYANAKTIFEKASEMERDNVNAWVSLAECYKATLQLPESLDKAISSFEKANSLNPNNPNITLNLGVLYFRKNDCDKSVKLLQKVQSFPGLNEEEKEVIATCLKQCGAG